MKGTYFKGFLFTALAGTLLHFLYDWVPNPLTALVSGVNESVWEHMKLLFVPVFLYLAVSGANRAAGAVSLAVGLAVIAGVYYTYTGALGFRITALDIGLYDVAAAVTFRLQRRLAHRWTLRGQQAAAWVLLTVMGLSFIVWTFYPPRVPLFRDPVTAEYGLDANP